MITADAKRILIISSDSALVEMLPDLLREVGYEPFTTKEIVTAIVELERVHPHLVILDMDDRAADALLFLETLRTNPSPRIADVPVIIGSEKGNLMEIDRALKLGVKDYFIKSKLEPEEAVAKVKKFFDAGKSALGSPPKAKVLMVEDDKFLRELAVQKFTKDGLEALSAIDGEQGLGIAEKELPDVILLDIMLPSIDGFEALKRIRKNPALNKTHIFMLSNFSQSEDVARAHGLGADAFLVKANFTLDEIADMVKKHLATPRK